MAASSMCAGGAKRGPAPVANSSLRCRLGRETRHEPGAIDDPASFTLANGHRLGFVEWGDPDDFPAFYNHGTPGSRLEGSFADFAARRHGFRLIAVDRPGSGGSTFQPARPRLADVVALADLLRGSDLASSAVGGPHLFACGVAIDPERLRFIGALGPWV